MKHCSVDGCDRQANVPGSAKGLCAPHYHRLRKYGDPLGVPEKKPRKPRPRKRDEVCTIEGCERAHKARGCCAKHYHRWLRHGDPLAGGPERLFKSGAVCLVDGCDEPSKSRGYCGRHVNRIRQGIPLDYKPAYRYRTSSGYIVFILDGEAKGKKHSNQRVSEHRLVMEQHLGRGLVAEEEVHHINGIRDDNRLENLELWSSSQPSGQRVVDKLRWAREIMALYEPLEERHLIQ